MNEMQKLAETRQRVLVEACGTAKAARDAELDPKTTVHFFYKKDGSLGVTVGTRA